MDTRAAFDVLGIGCAAVDELLYVEAFPPPDAKTRLLSRGQQCGGLTGTALVAAARLGARCAYAGRLGTGANSRMTEENFVSEHIDTAHAPRSEDYRVVYSTIVVGVKTGTRNVFSLSQGLIGAHETLPPEDIIRASRVLFVDHHGVPGSIRAAQIARRASIAVVADFERNDAPGFSDLLALVDHLVLSEAFACALTEKASATDAALALWNTQRSAVIVTCGVNGCWFISAHDNVPRHMPAFRVQPVDTTGCGDVFHGAYATGLAFGMDLRERIRFASAAAAIKATRRGAQQGAPSRQEVEVFLNASAQGKTQP